MAKLDEMAELLTEEIKGFENSVARMERLKKFLMEYKIQADTTDIDFILKRYNDHQRKAVEEQHKVMANAVRSIKDSMVLPNWVGKLFGILFLIVTLVLGYSVHQVSRISAREYTAFKKGEDEALLHFRTFFEANPEAGELYKKWAEPKNKK